MYASCPRELLTWGVCAFVCVFPAGMNLLDVHLGFAVCALSSVAVSVNVLCSTSPPAETRLTVYRRLNIISRFREYLTAPWSNLNEKLPRWS